MVRSPRGRWGEPTAAATRVRAAVELEVDGGIDPETAPKAVEAGARVLVVGMERLPTVGLG